MLRGAARGGLANLAGTVCTGIAGLGVTWLAARALDPRGAGAFFAATAVFGLGVTVAKLGVQTSLVYWPARMRAVGDLTCLGECLRAALVPLAVADAGRASGRRRLAGSPRTCCPAGRDPGADPRGVPAGGRAHRRAARRDPRPTGRCARPCCSTGSCGPRRSWSLLALVWVTGVAAADVFAALWALPYLPAALLAGVALTRLRAPGSAGPPRRRVSRPTSPRGASGRSPRREPSPASRRWRCSASTCCSSPRSPASPRPPSTPSPAGS